MYYKSLDKTISNREQNNHRLTEQLIDIQAGSKQRYGTPKIQIILARRFPGQSQMSATIYEKILH